MTARLATAAVVLALAAACGDDSPSPAEEAEAGIAAVVAERLASAGTTSGAVAATCPDDLDPSVGETFACEIVVGDSDPVVVELSVQGSGTVELRRAVIPTAAAEDYLVGELETPAEGPVSVDCGDAPLLVADVGDELRCEVARRSDGALRTVTVTVVATDGTVRYVVEAPTSTTSAPAP